MVQRRGTVGGDRVDAKGGGPPRERHVVDGPRRDAESPEPEAGDQRGSQQEVLDADPSDACPSRPADQRIGRVVSPDDEPSRQSRPRRLLAGSRVEGKDLDVAAARLAAYHSAGCVGGGTREVRIAMGLYLDLQP